MLTREARPVLSHRLAAKLASQFGTPLHVLSRSKLEWAIREFREHLPDTVIHYAVKANRDANVLAYISGLNCEAEVCSDMEASATIAAGFSADNLIHTHPRPHPDNISNCYARGIRRFTYDDPASLANLATFAPECDLNLRLAMHSEAADLNLSHKFGCEVEQALEFAAEARRIGLRVSGVSFHVGDQCSESSAFISAIHKATEVVKLLQSDRHPIEVLDIGGGFPVPERERPVLAWSQFLPPIAETIRQVVTPLGVHTVVEPGRALVGECVTAIVSVVGVQKNRPTPDGEPRTWYYLDDGVYGTFSDRGDAGRRASRMGFMAQPTQSGPAIYPSVLAGPTGDGLDIVSWDCELPELKAGDILRCPVAGAYCMVTATEFNGVPLPKLTSIYSDPELLLEG